MATLREIDYSDHDSGILKRIAQSREALRMRRESLSEWSCRSRQHESAEIDYIDGWLIWLQSVGG